MLKISADSDSAFFNSSSTFLVVSSSTYTSYSISFLLFLFNLLVASNPLNSTALKVEFLFDLDMNYSSIITTAKLIQFSSELNVLLNLGSDLSQFIVEVTNSIPVKAVVYIPGVTKSLILSKDVSVPPLSSQFMTVSLLNQMLNTSFSNTSYNSPFYANLVLGHVIRASLSQATVIYCPDDSVTESTCPTVSSTSTFFTMTIIILIAVYFIFCYIFNHRPVVVFS